MRWWRHGWPDRIPRPKPRRLSEKEKDKILSAMTRAIAASPVLTYFGVQVRVLRGRYYVERRLEDDTIAVLGRITPLLAAKGALLLEAEHRVGSWHEVGQGSAQKLIKLIAGDTRGKFHGLGSLDTVLRKAGKGLTRLSVTMTGKNTFAYSETGAVCSAQEALFHFFGLPLAVIAEPSLWYSYHRVPRIVEASDDRTRVLVRFTAESLTASFSGTCLYAIHDGRWGAYTIRPSESKSIASAAAWLVKRNWQGWR